MNLRTSSRSAAVRPLYKQPASSYCAGRISGKALHVKLQMLHNQYDDIAIAVACPATADSCLYNSDREESTNEVHNAIWYTTLRKKAMSDSTTDVKYITSPTRFVNALKNTGLDSPLRSSFRRSIDFDISTSGIVFFAKDGSSGTAQPAHVNVYYIPLTIFTEKSNSRPCIINVRGFKGPSSSPVFPPNWDSVAFLKRGGLCRLEGQ